MDDIHFPDVKDIYFQHTILTYFICQPHVGSLLEHSNERKANASLNTLLAIWFSWLTFIW